MTSQNKPDHRTPVPPLPWIATLASQAAGRESVLDLACGSGRHGRLFLRAGCAVTFTDIDLGGVGDLASDPKATLYQADLEGGSWPFEPESFDLVVVTNYLWRPRLDALLRTVRPGGALLYQTFAVGNERFGKPSNPAFLLREGELKQAAAPNFEIAGYFHGETQSPKPAVIQRLHAVRRTGSYSPALASENGDGLR